jgi:3-oxoacyl-[acyl-carrier-protein] synthase II
MLAMPVITGLGLITPMGADVPSNWQALLAGRCIVDHAKVSGIERPRALATAKLAAREAMENAGWGSDIARDFRTGLVVGTSKGAICEWLAQVSTTGSGLGEISSALSEHFFIVGPRTTISAACASGLQALIWGAMWIRTGQADRVLVVATEASVHPMFISSFQRLGVIAQEGHGCRPFDRQRCGFLMSEAAAAVCLESAESAGKILARINRFALGGDALTITSSDPTGRTLRRLLHQVIDGRPVDLIHAHGTGTEINDPVELSAIEAMIPEQSPPSLYSHKGSLGHSLGASGLVSVVINCLCHSEGIVPPNAQTIDPIPTSRVRIDSIPRQISIHHSIAIASGFGGAAAALSLCSA